MLKNRNITAVALCLVFLVTLAGCGEKARKPQAELDTPGHHVANGHKLLEKGRVDDAKREFQMARELDPKFAPAYTGLGIAMAQAGEYEPAMDQMGKARKYAESDGDKMDMHVGYVRVYTMGGDRIDKDWVEEAEDHFEDASELGPNTAAPYFYMGVAYKNGYRFSEAARMFSKVIDLNGPYLAKADKEYAEVQKIERAMPGSTIGKQIALVNEISRADVAALFIQELELDRLLEKTTPKTYDTAFKSPGKEYTADKVVKTPKVTDVDDHVLKTDIDTVVAYDLRGLRPLPDHTFQPDKPITRAEYALMMEDILIKLTRDDALATRFIASPSPFPDVRNDMGYFNAVMVVTSRNIMKAQNLATGEFEPTGPVSGADALLGIRALKGIIQQ